jgi:hypothetical protein
VYIKKLAHPLVIDGVEVVEIVLRRPDVAALVAIEALGITDAAPPSLAQMLAIVAALARRPVDVIGQIDPEDFADLATQAADLLAGATPAAPGARRTSRRG